MTSTSSPPNRVGALLLIFATAVGFSCNFAKSREKGGVSNIYSPPGAVASALIEPGEPKPLRTYGPENQTWPEIRTSLGHTVHRGSDKVLCKDCHGKEGFKHEGQGGCGRESCHATEAKHPHGAIDNETNSGCISCHAFHPGVAKKTCVECHKEEQAKTGGKKLAAIVDGHAKADCNKCHQPHKEPLTSAADCSTCHEQKATAHASHKGSKGCSDCHATHAPAKLAAKTCTGCHAKPEGPKPAKHASCLTCHSKHADKTSSCESCHSKVVTLASAKVPQHGKCKSCHTPHDPLEVGTSCQKCHSKVAVGHAKADNARGTKNTPANYASKGATSVNSCRACHDPHPTDASIKAVACTSCHSSISKSDQGAHAAPLHCSGCHEKHALKAPAKETIPALCSSCHTPQAKLVSTNKGHADCTTCHGGSAHALAAPSTCTSCHATELASAPKGHQKCSTCHETHGGKLTAKAECASCHEERTKGPHNKIKNSCNNCHRAHGPKGTAKTPTCQTCHKADQLLGLHVKHRDCGKCHTAHAWPNTTRESCTSAGCHAKMAKHQPAAKTCTGCHVFTKP